jgi:hypothetical protein
MLCREQIAVIVKTMRNTQIHSVGRVQSFSVHTEPLGSKGLIKGTFLCMCTYKFRWEDASLIITENTSLP